MVLVRTTQLVLLACALTVFTVVGEGRHDFSFLTYVFFWPALLLDYVIRSRIQQQPPPTAARKVLAVIGVAAIAAWTSWAVFFEVHGVPGVDRKAAWVLTGCTGYVLIVAGVTAAQRARYFHWRHEPPS